MKNQMDYLFSDTRLIICLQMCFVVVLMQVLIETTDNVTWSFHAHKLSMSSPNMIFNDYTLVDLKHI